MLLTFIAVALVLTFVGLALVAWGLLKKRTGEEDTVRREANLTLLQDAQQLHLQRNRHITDLVEKQRTALSGLE